MFYTWMLTCRQCYMLVALFFSLSFLTFPSSLPIFPVLHQGSRVPRPMRNWAESRLSPELLKAVEKAGYSKPSPIQMAAIPIGLQQRDVIGIAETGGRSGNGDNGMA